MNLTLQEKSLPTSCTTDLTFTAAQKTSPSKTCVTTGMKDPRQREPWRFVKNSAAGPA
ncbi:hypothetical protein CBM2610_P150005 [Cupriavidus taiwanensis]|nr:hypothetical protein CBM2610_P150005 [Cupriavidus taiwanensis]